ncbi:putative mitochondrial protein [Tanacetum coccineum]
MTGTPQTCDKFTQHGFDCRMRKLKMPLFDGKDAYGWIYRVERYFEIQGIPQQEQLRVAILCMEGEALSWYHWSKGQTPFHTSYMGKIQKLVGISKEVIEAMFIKGLKTNLRATVQVMKTEGLSYVMELVISIEDNQRVGVGVDTQQKEEASRDEDDHVHLDIVDVSLNSVLGFTSPPTMKLHGNIHAADVVVFADCGATYNFIAQGLLDQLGLEDTGSKIVGVILGNGKVEKSQGICKGVLVTFPKMQINEDFFPFELGSTDMILGIKWLETLGDMSVN